MECEIHICPILMRTVKFIDGHCEEQCDEVDCPIEWVTSKGDTDGISGSI